MENEKSNLPKMPKTLDLGFGDVVEVQYLQTVLRIPRRTAMKYLRVLHIEPFYVGKDAYFSLSTFKRIMFVLSKPGSKGFLFPGSKMKANPRTISDPHFLREVTPEILQEANDPKTLLEMSASAGRNMNLVKRLFTSTEDTK